MKSSQLLLALAILFITSSSLVRAVDATASPLKERNETIKTINKEAKDDRNAAIRELKESKASDAAFLRKTLEQNREDRKSSISATRQKYRSERAEVHGERIERRFAFYAERLTNIATRIQTRIEKKKSEGADVSAAQTTLNAAKIQLSTAISDGKLAVSLFQNITIATWDLQQPEIKAAVTQANKARSGFVSARKGLADAVTALK